MTETASPRCAICGEKEPLGLDICVNCGGAPEDSGDALVFLEAPCSYESKHTTMTMLRRFLGPERMPSPSSGDLLATGHRALLRVRRETATRVVDRLYAGGVAAVVRDSNAVTSLPGPFNWLLITTMTVGLWTGFTVDPVFLFTTPIMAVGLWLAAQLRMRRPAIRSNALLRLFPKPVEREILDAFATLTPGGARNLLARLVHSAEKLFATPGGSQNALTRADLEELVSSSCHAACDLNAVEESAKNLTHPREVLAAERLKTKMENKFRDAITVLHHLESGNA
jgi:hypothetical protein